MYNMKGNYYKLLIENKLFVVKNKEVLARPSGYKKLSTNSLETKQRI